MLKVERVRNNMAILRHAVDVKIAVMKALDDQNNIVIGEETLTGSSTDEEHIFVEVDFNSEILFDENPAGGEVEQSVMIADSHPNEQGSDVLMEICTVDDISVKRHEETKPRAENDAGARCVRRRKRRTLIQRMKNKVRDRF